jgi:hypothetical protein
MADKGIIKNTAQKAGYSEQIITFLSGLIQTFPDGCEISWCYVYSALEQHYSEADIIKLSLTAPHCAGRFHPVYRPEPTMEALISHGEELYKRHCNADGSFRFEDFDTPEKLQAFKRERNL